MSFLVNGYYLIGGFTLLPVTTMDGTEFTFVWAGRYGSASVEEHGNRQYKLIIDDKTELPLKLGDTESYANVRQGGSASFVFITINHTELRERLGNPSGP
eukprot:237353_1